MSQFARKMVTLENQLYTSPNLSRNCKVDLIHHIDQLQLHNSRLPKKPATVFDEGLPSVVDASTRLRDIRGKSHVKAKENARRRFLRNKEKQEENLRSAALVASTNKTPFFKNYKIRYHNELNGSSPFQNERTRNELTGVEEDFANRYAEYGTNGEAGREAKDGQGASTAAEAYKKAFHSYMHRDPTDLEMHEASCLYFGFNELGEVGVIQKPHSCFPHSHFSCCHRRPVVCPSQVYKRDIPQVRAARDRFPGPIPIWSSTKNLSTLVSSDVYVPGHHKTRGITLPPVNNMVTSKGIRI